MSKPSIHLLIIDDHEDDRHIYKTFLNKNKDIDFTYLEAGTGEEGLELYRKSGADCILVDYNLPDMNGIDLLSNFENFQQQDGLAIVAITAQGSEEIAAEFIAKGANEYLGKKYVSTDTLTKTILNAIEKARLKKTILDQQEEIIKKNRELENSNLYLQDFCHTVAHDLKNPLHSIMSFLNILKETPDNDTSQRKEHKEILGLVIQSSNRMARLINDLLDYANSTKKKSSIESLDLNDLIDEVRMDLSKIIQDKSAQLSVETMPKLLANKSQIYQIFLNLISNGIKYSKPDVPPIIKVYSKILGDEGKANNKTQLCQIFIEDNGIGIAKEHQHKIFEPFNRLHSDEEIEGSGIGLATVKKIIAHHYGSIMLKSTLGVGTTMIITIPLRAEDRNMRCEPRIRKDYLEEISFVGYSMKDQSGTITILDETTKGLGCSYSGDQNIQVGDILGIRNKDKYEVCWIKQDGESDYQFGLKKL